MKNKINVVLGLIQILIAVYWIYEMILLYYRYYYADTLFAFMYPNRVIFLNIILSIVSIFFGIKLMNRKIVTLKP
jgi:hypothetical protein